MLEAAGATVHVGLGVALDDAAAYERSLAQLGEWMAGRFDLVVGFTVTSFPAVDVAGRVGLPSVLRIGEAEPLRTLVAWLFGPLDPEGVLMSFGASVDEAQCQSLRSMSP